MSANDYGKSVLYPEVSDVWRHFKGGTYRIVAVAQHTEGEGLLVVYQACERGGLWARPLTGPKGFLTPEGDQPRFVLLERDGRGVGGDVVERVDPFATEDLS